MLINFLNLLNNVSREHLSGFLYMLIYQSENVNPWRHRTFCVTQADLRSSKMNRKNDLGQFSLKCSRVFKMFAPSLCFLQQLTNENG